MPLFLTVFALVLLAELADKTQLVTFALVAETGKPVQVYLGVLGGLFTVTALGVLLGSLIGLFVPLTLVQLIAGLVFIVLGIFAIYRVRRNDHDEEPTTTHGTRVWVRAFILLFLAELGDKTQLIVILIAATTGQLLLVFAAAFLALALVNGISVFVGNRARKYLSTTTITYVAASAFIIAGALVLIGSLLP
ncbi:MAG: TMEM165/GDT1 family protein [Candidatus Hermodarchaeia archaeon]